MNKEEITTEDKILLVKELLYATRQYAGLKSYIGIDGINELQQENKKLKERIDNQDFLLKSQGKELKELYSIINKAIEYIENKLSTDTYQHLKKLYDDIDETEYVWEEYEFYDILEILKGE